MPNNFKNDEQRQKWYDYNTKYSKKNYRTFCIKLNRVKDKELIDYLEGSGETATSVIKKLLSEKLGNR